MFLSTTTFLGLLAAVYQVRAAVLTKTAVNYPYSAWPSNVIKYRIGTGFVNEETQSIRDAMQQISEDTGRCIQFVQDTLPTSSASTVPFVQINHAFPAPGNNAACFTYPGFNRQQLPNNIGQLAVMFGAAGGGNADGACLGAGRQRNAMALLVNLLGQQNEWQRSDRESVMTFSAADDAGRNALVKSGVATKFFFNRANQLTDTVASNVGAFDPKSITMLTGDHYAKDTTKPVFTVPANTQVGTLARLSVQDCQALMSMYGRNCPVTGTGSRPTCTSLDPYASSLQPAVPGPNTGVVAPIVGPGVQLDENGNIIL